jgi:hypothetical protein
MEYIINPESSRIEITCPPSATQIHSYEPISNSNFCRADQQYITEFAAKLGETAQPIIDITGSSPFEIATKYIKIPTAKNPYKLTHKITERLGAISDVTIKSANFDYKAQVQIMRIRAESSSFKNDTSNYGEIFFGGDDSSRFNPDAVNAKILTESTALLYATIDILTILKENKQLYYPTEFLKYMNSHIDPKSVLSSFEIENNQRNTVILLDIIKKFCFDPDHYDITKEVKSRLPIKLYDTQTIKNKQFHTLIPEINSSIVEFSMKLKEAYLTYLSQKKQFNETTK